ncbi:MAG: molybdopterin dinucleotide binding domain-containing protein, partial [Pseudomonadota bacterium]
SSQKKEGKPSVFIHPEDAAVHFIADGADVALENHRGRVLLAARHFPGVTRGTLISEGLFPNDAFVDGRGINCLVGADPVAPYGGAAFHDIRVSITPQ